MPGNRVKIVRLFSGDDQEAHLEDLTSDQLVALLPRIIGDQTYLNRIPAGTFQDFHTSPQPQIIVQLSGAAEYLTADGSKASLTVGDILVTEDITGHGHTMRNPSDEARLSINLPFV